MPANTLNMEWWNSLSQNQQKQYINEHKTTEYRKHLKMDNGTSDKKPITEEKPVNYNDAIQKSVENEVKKRKLAEHVKHHAKTLHHRIKKFHAEQRKFFQEGEEKPNSEARTTAADIIHRKAHGIVKKFKHELHEDKEAYTEAAKAIRNILTGKSLDDSEKKHLKSAATKLAILAGMTLATGGAGGLVHGVGIGVAHFGAHAVAHRLLEAGIVGSAASLVYASAMFEYATKLIDSNKIDKMTDDEVLEYFVKMMGEGVKSAPIKTKQWVEAFEKHNKNERRVKAMLQECV